MLTGAERAADTHDEAATPATITEPARSTPRRDNRPAIELEIRVIGVSWDRSGEMACGAIRAFSASANSGFQSDMR
jgi:hypothetical protein